MVSLTAQGGSEVMGCSICNNKVDEQTAPIIAMGGYGYPRYICDECAEKIEIITHSRDVDEIKAGIADIVDKMENGELNDKILIKSVCEILDTAKERLLLIERGEYDFSLDESDSADEEGDIPEELLESEEDKIIDEREKEEKRRFDNIFNWVALGVFSVVLIAGILFILLR